MDKKKPGWEFDLHGRRAIVTGAASGIGRACAETLARYGAEVILADLNSSSLGELAERLTADYGAPAWPQQLDVTDLASLNAVVTDLNRRLGRLDILVNSAGVNRPQPAEDVDEAAWDLVQNVNLKGSFFCCQAVGRIMIAQGYGKIINISSQAGSRGLLKRAAYCSSKGGLDQITRVLALEWSKYGVNVNSLAPTFVETPFTEEMFKDAAFRAYVDSKLLIPRLATVEDLAGPLIFLASRASDMMTGSVLYVDGGWTAH
ncbi:MAG: SDR family oxidoreductase [Deltaproteobacteria bacterium]|jgi:2-deoxy-D-gluconate 3-dehydrogenase|nr:SDR family oxidoreductase [Deltaproteobacteria bacterium]